MRITKLTAISDLVGRRLRVSWEFVPDARETVADAPQVRLRRKLRDFDFPVPTPNDPFLVYDSAHFPPEPSAGLQVTDLPEWAVDDESGHTVYAAVSLAQPFGGRFIEILRRSVGTTFDANGVARRQRVEILDVGGAPSALSPGRTYYYELSGSATALPAVDDPSAYRASVAATESFGTNRSLYELLPSIFRRHDVVARPLTPGTETVPEAASRSGQLRRFIDLFGIGFDSLRSSAESLRGLHDVDEADARYLPLLARWIGWDLSFTAGIPLQRNELKSASRLYRTVGTVPGLRALVSQYTGWFTQVAEFAQHLSRAGDAPSYNVFAATEVGSTWLGADDASNALGFGAANGEAAGSGALPARLVGSAVQPFALRRDMTLALAVDGLLPVAVRFEPADFEDMAAASAAEVVAVLTRVFHELSAQVDGGCVVLTSNTAGPLSTIRVEQRDASLVTLEAAPGGRLSLIRDSRARTRLFYETTDTLAGAHPARRLRYKTLVDGAWRGSREVSAASSATRGSPAAVQLPGGPMLLTWIEAPHTAAAELRLALGRRRAEEPARLYGRTREPFSLNVGAKLTIVGDFAGPDVFSVNRADYVDPHRATAAELSAAMNAQLSRVSVSQVDGALRMVGPSSGPRARLKIDLAQSTTARALGFAPENASARGSWDDEIDWEPPQAIPPVALGWHEDLCAAPDPLGGARIFWSRHVSGPVAGFRLTTARWDGGMWVATAGGVSVRGMNGSWMGFTTATGLASNEVRALALDAQGGSWFATASGASLRRANGAWSTFTTLDGLASDDVRALTLDWAGNTWFATADGASVRDTGGTWTSFRTSDGLAANDVRALAVDPRDGLWFATADGLSHRDSAGSWASLPLPLPASRDVRSVRFDARGKLWLATAAGVLAWDGVRLEAVAEADSNDDARDVAIGADGTLWIASAAGVKARGPAGQWRTFSTASGLPSNDTRGVTVAPDGSVWVATASGAAVLGSDGAFRTFDNTNGLLANDVRSVHGPWSALLDLSAQSPTNGGDREPCALVDDAGRTWVVWSQRQGGADGADDRLLRWRHLDPASGGWSDEAALTTTAVGVHAADREPAGIFDATRGLRVFFVSDRGGGSRLWSLTLGSDGSVSAPVASSDNPANDRGPAPLYLDSAPGAPLLLLFRSDRNVALAQVSAGEEHSSRLPDEGAIRRFAGTTSVVANDLVRNRARHQWGDLLSYTPQKPLGALDAPLTEEDRYTRGTIGIFVRRGRLGNPLTRQEVARMRQLLTTFLPINVRALLILAPSIDTELLYAPGADIGEAYSDRHPFVDALTTLGDSARAALVGWSFLLSNATGHVSADPRDPLTLRRRSYHEPPE